MFDILRSATPLDESFLFAGWSEFATGTNANNEFERPWAKEKIKLDGKMKIR
jgi:hypothetical protein